MSYEEELSKEEEKKLVRRGGCIATVLLIIGGCCCTGIFTSYTAQGRNLVGWYFLEELTNGIFMESSFESYAQQSCDLARESPRPADYEERQDRLAQGYQTSLRLYRKYWIRMRRDGGDVTKFESPDQLPQDLRASKSRYCR